MSQPAAAHQGSPPSEGFRPAQASLVFPSQGYACLQCGKSCLSGWRVWLETESYERLNAHALTAKLRRGGYEPLAVYPIGPAALVPPPGKACVYLSSETLCKLHQLDGPEAKPRTCQHFPFSLLETPGGCQVGVTFRCTAVQKNHVASSWEEHRPTLERLRVSGTYPRVGWEPIQARPDLTMGWDDYLEWEAGALTREPWDSLGELLLVPGAELRAILEPGLSPHLVAWMEGDRNIAGHLLSQGRFHSPTFQVELTWGPADGLLDLETSRFVRHLVERKFLLLGPSFCGRLTVLALLHSMSARYVGALATHEGDPLQCFWRTVEMLESRLFADEEPFYEAVQQATLNFAQRI